MWALGVSALTWLADPRGRLVDVSPWTCRRLGLSRDEVLSRPIGEIDPRLSPQRWGEVWEELERAGHLAIETELRTGSGEAFPVEGSMGYVELAGVGYACAVVVDVGERTRVWQALSEAREELERLVKARTASVEEANRQLAQEVAERKQAEERLASHQERLRGLASELALAEERERRRIAADLHDRIGQALSLAVVKLTTMQERDRPGEVGGELAECIDLIDRSVQDTRSLIFDLSPPVLYDMGIEAAAEWLVERRQGCGGVRIVFEDDARPKPLDDGPRVILFRAIRELVHNVVKHSRARTAALSLARAGDQIRISVEDDGVGFDLASGEFGPGFGLFDLREQVGRIGGRVEVSSAPGEGTRVSVWAPLSKSDDRRAGLP